MQIKFGDDELLIKLECLGLVDCLFVPHAHKEGRLEIVKEMLKSTNDIGILLSNCAALEIIDDQYKIIISDASFHRITAQGLKVYWKDDECIVEKIVESTELKPLKKLLNRN